MLRPRFLRLPPSRRARLRAESHTLAAPIDAEPTIVNPAGYQEDEPTREAIAGDQALHDNCALLQRARAEDPANCKDTAVPVLLKKTRRRRKA